MIVLILINFTVNFEQISHCSDISLDDFEQLNAVWVFADLRLIIVQKIGYERPRNSQVQGFKKNVWKI